MDVYLLGAGSPAYGRRPSALKEIALDFRAMDWQIHSFEGIASLSNIHYLGGYHIDEVIEAYPALNFTVVSDWKSNSVLHTLLKAPFSNTAALISYSDTLFRQEVINQIVRFDADVVYAVDSDWRQRYSFRSEDDIRNAETVHLSEQDRELEVEFTGLMYLSPNVVKFLKSAQEHLIGSTLIELLHFLTAEGFSSTSYDVAGHWAEFNSSNDIAKFILGTKADTLKRLEPRVKCSVIGKQVAFTVSQWGDNPGDVVSRIEQSFADARLIIRSSSKREDNWYSSNAGGHESLLDIDGSDRSKVEKAIFTVIDSYGEQPSPDDQVLVQEFLSDVQFAGVVFTCDLETGSPYYRFNFDDTSRSTESVTDGTGSGLRTVIVNRFGQDRVATVEPKLVIVMEAIAELERLLGYDKLDVEFAVSNNGEVHIFQVRPITVDHTSHEIDAPLIRDSLNNCAAFFKSQQTSKPFVSGESSIFANMPDWNPAEIIGTRPKPLAFSLYRKLITDEVWAQQRYEYGYQDVRPSKLLYSFCGQPYVDVRASINSFIPAGLPTETRKRIADAYIHILRTKPEYHDKLEFEVVFTIWTPQFSKQAKKRFAGTSVAQEDIALLEAGLKKVTQNALIRLSTDTADIKQLAMRREFLRTSDLSVAEKVCSLIEDCKRYGTLAFAHAARAGFVANTILNSLVEDIVLTDGRRNQFLASLNTVAGDFISDKIAFAEGRLTQDQLIHRYGHLRPGTYEISSSAYWENPEQYLTSNFDGHAYDEMDFTFNADEIEGLTRFLDKLESSCSPQQLHQFLQDAIAARESVKFEFTKNLSHALDNIVVLGESISLSRDDLSFLEYEDIEKLSLNLHYADDLRKRIDARKDKHGLTRSVHLPTMITSVDEIYAFEQQSTVPNFVTHKKIESAVQNLEHEQSSDLAGKIVLIPQADPGYDWLFGHGVGGLVTKYGGANSHMAIRSAEIGLPAAIGVGEKLYDQITRMRIVELDCANKIIREVQ